MEEIILQNKNGKILASSRDVAEKFGKRNPDVNRSIENLIVQNCTVKNMFEKRHTSVVVVEKKTNT